MTTTILLPSLTWEDAAIVAARGRYAVDENVFVYQIHYGPYALSGGSAPEDHWDIVGYQGRILIASRDGATIDMLVENLAEHLGDLDPVDRVEGPDAAPRTFFFSPDPIAGFDPKWIAGGTVKTHNQDAAASQALPSA